MEGDCIRDGMAAGVDVIHVLEQEVSIDIARDLLHYLAFQAAVGHGIVVQVLINTSCKSAQCLARLARSLLPAVLANAGTPAILA